MHDQPPAGWHAPTDRAHGRPIRILALIEATTLTGVARSVLGFAEALPPAGGRRAVTVAIVIMARGATLDGPLARAARDARLSVSVLAERRRFDPGALRHLRRLCAKFQPDVIQSHAVKSHVLIWLAGLWHRHVWIAFHHGYTYTDVKTCAYNALDRVTLRHAHHVVTVAGAFRGDLVRRGVEEARLSVLHNATPAYRPPTRAALDRLREQLRLPPGTPVVAAVGRLSSEKRHVDLIRAFAGVRASVPHSHLVIAGDGPERLRLEREIDDAGLVGRVTLPGELHDVSPLYELADVMVLPSATEGCPSVLLEAMAAGVPVVATRVGGIPEIVTHGRTALLVRPGEVEDLAHATVGLLLDRPLAQRLARDAVRHVAEHHNPTARAKHLAAIHDAALAVRAGGGPVGRPPGARTSGAMAGGSEPCAF